MEKRRIPLFPLHTVLFPGGVLPLRVFEPRYLDMISACMREGSRFGVCLIRQGKEVGEAALPYHIGTEVSITDWQLREDGFLGITVRGERRYRILSTEVGACQLLHAEVESLADEPALPLPRQFRAGVEVLQAMIAEVGGHYAHAATHYDDATWVSGRLAELLPIGLEQKQHLLHLDDPVERLERLCAMWDCLCGEE